MAVSCSRFSITCNKFHFELNRYFCTSKAEHVPCMGTANELALSDTPTHYSQYGGVWLLTCWTSILVGISAYAPKTCPQSIFIHPTELEAAVHWAWGSQKGLCTCIQLSGRKSVAVLMLSQPEWSGGVTWVKSLIMWMSSVPQSYLVPSRVDPLK